MRSLNELRVQPLCELFQAQQHNSWVVDTTHSVATVQPSLAGLGLARLLLRDTVTVPRIYTCIRARDGMRGQGRASA